MVQIEVSEDMIQIDANILARAFEINVDDLKRHMRDGKITSRAERGEGDDIGKMRLTFSSDDRRIRIVTDDCGALLTCDIARIDRSLSPIIRKARIDALLDEALAESFPASDPIAITIEYPHWTARSPKKPDKG